MNEPKTIVIGLGVTGTSCVRYLKDKCQVFATDTRLNNTEFQLSRLTQDLIEEHESITHVNPDQITDYAGSNTRLIVTPGVPLTCDIVRSCIDAGCVLTSDVDLFLSSFTGLVIGVTGTNGKTTVVSLTARMLASKGFKAAGNIGTPALDLLGTEMHGVVLELSSFQLERMQAHHFQAVALLNVSDDHLDHHGDFESYKRAKHRIFGDFDLAVFDADDVNTYPPDLVNAIGVNGNPDWCVQEEFLIVNGQRIPRSMVRLPGEHNGFNLVVAAALAHCAGASHDDIVEVITSFTGLAHRTKCVARINDVDYINDSKATNVGATNAAMTAFGSKLNKNVILIAGGVGKDATFTELKPHLNEYVKTAILFGRDAPRMAGEIDGSVLCKLVPDLDAAIVRASRIASPDDIVLFSPACASFDQYDNYARRGEAFEAGVGRLRV